MPDGWAGAPRVAIDRRGLDDPSSLASLVDRLHRTWASREPFVLEWDIGDDALGVAEVHEGPVWQLDAEFTFPMERLRFLAFSNSYDARSGAMRWWWADKAAARIGGAPGGSADLVLPDGTDVWIDGGPRVTCPPCDPGVIHCEDVELGRQTRVHARRDAVPDGLAPDQLAAVEVSSGAARIIAPAGSGKTRTLVARLRHMVDGVGVAPDHVMALAYNARAAEELRGRLGSGRSGVRTIHSLGWRILLEARPGLSLMGEREVRDLLARFVQVPHRPNSDPLGPYVEALETVRAGLRSPATVESERDDIDGFAEAFEPMREQMYARGTVDHGEQVYGAIEVLVTDPAARRRWQDRCRHLLVDEFQDLTPAYVLLLRLVASPQLEVFGVGDDDQVIYGYAGADPGFLIDYGDYFPGAAEHALVENHRCPAAVVEASSSLLSYNRRRIEKAIGSASGRRGGLRVVASPGDRLAIGAAEIIEQWRGAGVATADIAVLARVNSSLIPVRAALGDRGVPVNDMLDEQGLRRTQMRALLAWIRIATRDPAPTSDLLEAIRRPGRGLTRVSRDVLRRASYDIDDLESLGDRLEGGQVGRFADFVYDVRAARASVSRGSGALVDLVVDEIGLGSSARTLDAGRLNASRSGHADDLVAMRRAAEIHEDADTFEPWLTDALRGPTDVSGVTLATVHRVKGMEWPRVIVFGADDGSMPHVLSDDVEEERRVFHVALTRGIAEVVVLHDAAKPSRFVAEMTGDAPRERQPEQAARKERRRAIATGDTVRVLGGYSGRVAGIDEAIVYVELETGAQLAVRRDEVLEITPASAPIADQRMVEALRAWRLETSRRLGVPAYVVLHDATLEAIASARPSDERSLLALPGIGPAKLESYGDEILGIVAEGAAAGGAAAEGAASPGSHGSIDPYIP